MTEYRDNLEDNDFQERPDLETTLNTLKESEQRDTLEAKLFYGFSNLSLEEANQVQSVWQTLTLEHRRKFMQRLIDVAEANVELDYRSFCLMVFEDRDPEIREAAIEVLWEDESTQVMDRLIEMAQWDESVQVRAAAASALGNFVLLGEMGDLPEAEISRVQDAVVSLLADFDEDVDVRRRALESIANSNHDLVEDAITEAYESGDDRMRASAIFAMGRTYDPRWGEVVMREMDSDNPEMRYEAARSSGALELSEAVPGLVRIASSDEQEIREVAIWSLGEIGGHGAMKALGRLAEAAEDAGDDALLEAIEEAIGNASMVGSDMMFDFDEE